MTEGAPAGTPGATPGPAIGVSAIINPPPVHTEADIATATARMEFLKADEGFMKRVAAKDVAAFEEYNRLWRVTHGLPIEPVAPAGAADVFKQMEGQELAITERRAEIMRQDGIDEDGVFEYLNGRPILAKEQQWAVRELDRCKRDKAFCARYLDGDPDARERMTRLHRMVTMRPGTLADINAWEKAHGRPITKDEAAA